MNKRANSSMKQHIKTNPNSMKKSDNDSNGSQKNPSPNTQI